LDPEVWEVIIHLDGLDNLERRIARDDIIVMNLYAMIETHGFGFSDSMYCRQGEDMVLMQNNDQIYHLLEHFESTQVLTLSVKRGRKKKVMCLILWMQKQMKALQDLSLLHA
jgi:hypothetical protein